MEYALLLLEFLFFLLEQDMMGDLKWIIMLYVHIRNTFPTKTNGFD